jgi:hypothetical protein
MYNQYLFFKFLQAGTTSDNTSLRIDSSTRQDSGKYTITAKNDYGKDSADIEVVVVDKPGIPKGPLSYTSTTQDSVSLAWNPPTDDGGGDITGICLDIFTWNLGMLIINLTFLQTT